jgi:5,10-methylene-tetrahydrofolate dehydrogenase/methenyl tetrahydrofolate cyclohydrolase
VDWVSITDNAARCNGETALAMDDPCALVPCTPLGCLELLHAHEIATAGTRAVIVGRSLIVGEPMAMLLLRKGADTAVTVAHEVRKAQFLRLDSHDTG